MTAALVVHALVVATLLTLAAGAGESLLRALGRPARWIWAVALGGSVLLPASFLVRGGGDSGGGVVLAFEPVMVLGGGSGAPAMSFADRLMAAWDVALSGVGSPAAFLVERLSGVPGLTTLLSLIWGGLVVAALLLVAGALVRLHRSTRNLPLEVVEGRPVRVSEVLGPAVVGVAHPRIILPRRLLSAPRDHLRMIVAHEEEHLRARDTLLLAFGLGSVVLLPWSPLVWVQLRRLRLAIELDCDRRVLRRGISRVRYASLLLEAGSRSTSWSPAMAGLVESPSLLESRMKALCTPLRRVSLPRAVGMGMVTLLLVLAACEAPTPIVDDETGAELAADQASGDAVASSEDGPVVYLDGVRMGVAGGAGTPGDQEPLVYLDGVRMRLGNTLEDLDPSSIDRIEVIKGEAATSRFGPEAANGVIQIFTKEGAGDTREAAPVPAPEVAAADPEGELSAAPAFTPYTVAPQLKNAAEVVRALETEYPALLRNAGVGGQVLIHFFIDAEGVVQDTRVATSSGHEALDAAALRVGAVFEFSPALNLDVPTPVWIALPITFQARAGEDAAAAGSRVLVRDAATAPRTRGTAPLLRATPSRAGGAELADGPTFTPYTQAPRLINTAEVQEAMAREYPAMLRNAGIGGRALVHFLIDDTGAVADTRLEQTTGHEALDQAALRLAREFRFSPAQDEGRAVAVWIALPITFQVP